MFFRTLAIENIHGWRKMFVGCWIAEKRNPPLSSLPGNMHHGCNLMFPKGKAPCYGLFMWRGGTVFSATDSQSPVFFRKDSQGKKVLEFIHLHPLD